jgi:hypothetical protein
MGKNCSDSFLFSAKGHWLHVGGGSHHRWDPKGCVLKEFPLEFAADGNQMISLRAVLYQYRFPSKRV